jgi:NodT family efflux transporter outer membrane factor (OMF) lipoprotein
MFSIVLTVAVASLGGCTTGLNRWIQQGFKVGPEYASPSAAVAGEWIETGDSHLAQQNPEGQWWAVFGDPMLEGLVTEASEQNLQLREAGARILESRARLAVARGNLFPQRQEAFGSFTHSQLSETVANPKNELHFDNWNTGFNAYWELDFWGRFRRNIEFSEANLGAAVEDYRDVLVLLQAEVASAYIQIRVLQERIELAERNVKLQEGTLSLADLRFKGGKTTKLDVSQARENLAATQALIPALEGSLRESQNALCILLSVPPQNLEADLGHSPIPQAPSAVAVGIPAELLTRRPDVRQAERLLAAQSARIGIAESELYPHIAITGAIGYESRNLSSLFQSNSFAGIIGPAFSWNILNYGRIINDVRAEEARFRQLLFNYRDTVLNANQEVEDAISGFLRERERVVFLEEGVTASGESVKTARNQYENGKVDFQRLLDSERALVRLQDELAAAQGRIVLQVVAIYKALAGGWQIGPAPGGSGEAKPPTAEPNAGTALEAPPVP